MKQLKFAEPLPGRILDGEKTTTWRINDKRGIVQGDHLSLCHNSGQEFAQAIATTVQEKTFAELTPEEKSIYPSDEEMYATFKNFYQMDVNPNTVVKIIHFKLLS